jgi:hypothetical protein
LTLQALDGPWLGGAWRMRASTLAPTGFAVPALGYDQLALPLRAASG